MKKLRRLLTLSMLCAVLLADATENEKEKKVLFLGIDGCRWEAIANTDAAPYLKQLMAESWTCTNALAQTPTWSSNGWAALLTGVTKDKHGWVLNEYGPDKGMDTYVSFFQHLKHEYPDLRTASFSSWADINDKCVRNAATYKFNSAGGDSKFMDNQLVDEIKKELNREDVASVIFVQLNDVDSQGHAAGFVLDNPRYLEALTIIDNHIKELITTVKARPNYSNEDWLFLITTDHGGNKNGHGGTTYEEQNTFFILNNPALKPTLIEGKPETITEMHDYAIQTLNLGEGISAELSNIETLGFDVDGSFTIEMRVRSTENNSDPVILGNKNWSSGSNKGFCIANSPYGGGNHVRFNLSDGEHGAINLDGAPMPENGDWVHTTCVVDREQNKAYIYHAGTLVQSADISAQGSLATDLPYLIGTAPDKASGYFDGHMAELRIFNIALPQETIEAYAAKPLDEQHPAFDHLVLYNPGNDGEGNTYQGAFNKPAISFQTTDAEKYPLTWSAPEKQLIGKTTTDYKGAPHTYDVPPTIFNFLGLPVRDGYCWDGKPLVSFYENITTDDEDGLPQATENVAVIDNFENNQINYTFSHTDLGFKSEVADNPKKDERNQSDKVLRLTRVDESHVDWICVWADLTPKAFETMDFDQYNYLSYKIYRTVEGASARAKIEKSASGLGDKEIDPVADPQKIEAWEEVYFPFAEQGANGKYRRLTLMPDFTTSHDAGVVVYIDDICVKKNIGDEIPSTPTDLPENNTTPVHVFTDGSTIEVHFALEQTENVSIYAYDMTGHPVFVHNYGQLHSGIHTLPISLSAKGMYLVQLIRGNHTTTIKCVY